MVEHAIDVTGEPPLTLAQWGEMGREDAPGEFVDGVLVEEEEVGFDHEDVVVWLAWAIKSWLVARGGFVFASDARFAVSPRRGRKPDLSVYFAGRKPDSRTLATRPPDIMVEVVSPRPRDARRDRVEKTKEYAAFGVRYYWIVDPAIRTFEIFELGADGRYVMAASASDGRIESVPGCEGLTLDLDAMWAELDNLDPLQDKP